MERIHGKEAAEGLGWARWLVEWAVPHLGADKLRGTTKEVQGAQRLPKKLDPRRNTPRHIIITLPKIRLNRRRES